MKRDRVYDLSRRGVLRSMIGGSILFPGIVAQLLADDAGPALEVDPLSPKSPHFPPKAKRVIFLYMSGGVSHVDSWDPKPKLFGDANKTVAVDEFQGRKGDFKMFLKRPQWEFAPHGACGTEVSSLFPHVAGCVDELCVIRSMKSDHTNHYEATLGIHTGSFTFARPSIGTWVSYGLGTLNRNLPSFVVIAPKSPYAGGQVWGSDFLPGAHQGTLVVPGPDPVANIKRRVASSRLQELELGVIAELNRRHLASRSGDPLLAARIKSFETAFGMQAEMPEVFDMSRESDATLEALRPGAWQHVGIRLAMSGRPAAGRARGAVRGADRFRLVGQLGCARRHAHAQRPGQERRSRDCGLAARLEAARDDGRHAGGLDDRVRPHAVQRDARRRRPRASSLGVFVMAGRCRREAGHDLRRVRRIRYQCREGSGARARFPRHDPAPDGSRSRAADLSAQRPRLPADGCRRHGCPRLACVKKMGHIQ